MTQFASTPQPPYYAVIFTSVLVSDSNDYHRMADRMIELASQQVGFLGIESARQSIGITVSYWQDLAAIKKWKQQSEHLLAQKMGRELWYSSFQVRIAKIEKDYGF